MKIRPAALLTLISCSPVFVTTGTAGLIESYKLEYGGNWAYAHNPCAEVLNIDSYGPWGTSTPPYHDYGGAAADVDGASASIFEEWIVGQSSFIFHSSWTLTVSSLTPGASASTGADVGLLFNIAKPCSYRFLDAAGNVTGTGIFARGLWSYNEEESDELAAIGQRKGSFYFRMELTPVADASNTALLSGMALVGFSLVRRRLTRKSRRQK